MNAQLEARPAPVEPTLIDSVVLNSEPHVDIDHLLDIPMRVTVVIGTLQMKLSALAQLQAGAVLRTQRSAGEPVDVHVNSCLLAQAEVCPKGDRLSVRLVELHPHE